MCSSLRGRFISSRHTLQLHHRHRTSSQTPPLHRRQRSSTQTRQLHSTHRRPQRRPRPRNDWRAVGWLPEDREPACRFNTLLPLPVLQSARELSIRRSRLMMHITKTSQVQERTAQWHPKRKPPLESFFLFLSRRQSCSSDSIVSRSVQPWTCQLLLGLPPHSRHFPSKKQRPIALRQKLRQALHRLLRRSLYAADQGS